MDPYAYTTDFNAKIIERLTDMGIDGQELVDRMKQENGEIAGSFPTQVLLNEKYASSDVDIFFKAIDINVFNNFSNWLFGKFSCFSTYDGSQENTESIISSRTYHINPKLKINVIYVNIENLNDHFANFDLSFCRTIYNGDNIRYLPDTLKKQGVINTVNSFVGSHRYKSYSGLNRSYETCVDPTINEYLGVLCSRISKYTKRGFRITNMGILDDYASIVYA